MSHNDPKEYNVSIHTNDVHAAIAQTTGALYELVEEALQGHEDHEAEECEFEFFARDILAVLTRHADQLSNNEEGSNGADRDEFDDED